MKIAYLFERFPSHTETFLAREVEALRKIGFDIEVWAIDAGNGARPLGLPPRALKVLGKTAFWQRAGADLRRAIRESGATHIHATWANHIALIAQNAARSSVARSSVAQGSELPWSFAAHAHDLWVEGGDLAAKMQSARFAATCTRAGETELRKFGANVLYAPHGLPLADFPFQAWEKPRQATVLGVGRLVEKKGWLDLIAAAALCHRADRRGPKTRFEIIGEGPLRALLEKQIAALGLNDMVCLRGALPPGDTFAAMREAHCLVLPSRRTSDGDRDGLPNVLLEAAATGIPIVSTHAGSAGDLVDDESGILVEPGQIERLAGAIDSVFSASQTSIARCRAARARVEADFDIDSNIAVLSRAFEANQK